MEAKSCFGSKAIVIDHSEVTPNNITISFGTSDLRFVMIIALFIGMATATLWLLRRADLDFSAFILIVSSFFIIRNRKQLRIIKK